MDNRYRSIEQANSGLPKAREISAGFFLFFCCEERFTPISFFLFMRHHLLLTMVSSPMAGVFRVCVAWREPLWVSGIASRGFLRAES